MSEAYWQAMQQEGDEMEPRHEFTDFIGLMNPSAATHAASFFRNHWKTLCGRRMRPLDVAVIGTSDDDMTPSCKQCQRLLIS